MNIKRIFGAILTILGIAGLIYVAILFVNTNGGNRDIRALIIYGVLGFIFLFQVSVLYVPQKMNRNGELCKLI